MFVLSSVALPAFRLQRVKEFTVDGDFSVHTHTHTHKEKGHLLPLLLVFFFVRPPFVFHVLSANLHKLLLDVKTPRVMREGGGGGYRVQAIFMHRETNRDRETVEQWDSGTVGQTHSNNSE